MNPFIRKQSSFRKFLIDIGIAVVLTAVYVVVHYLMEW